LRIAVVSPFVDRRHGTERALAELLERLVRDYGCEIHLYAQRVEDLSLRPPLRTLPADAPSIFWHKVPALPGPALVQFLSWFCLNWVWRWAHRRFRGASFDLVLSPGINCADADVVVVHALFRRLRELLLAENSEPQLQLGFLRRLHRRAYYGILARLEKRIYSKRSVALAAVSPRTAELLAKYFHRRDVAVIPNGVDTLQFSPAARLARRDAARARRQFRADDLVLLLIGNDWANKGLATILEALAALADIPARLLIVGDDAPGPWREMARRLGVLERCIWEPATADILEAYAAADLYVSPSREDSFGMPVAEAMACGLPVVTSVFAGVSSLLCDGVDSLVLRDPLDAKALAEAIRKIHKDAGFRARMGQAAAKASVEWTWDRNAAAVWELLKETSARRSSASRLRANS
jgi:glycosyltransferase involved in cell wall biosynthesis